MKKASLFVLCSTAVIFGCVLTTQVVMSIQFRQNCKGYLKRAADANTVSLAKQELGIALEYLERENMTTGSTHVFYPTPKSSVDFWYTNLQTAYNELDSIPPDADMLTKSNQLLNLRETIVDQGEHVRVTVPKYIALFPNQFAFIITDFLCLGVLGGAFVALASGSVKPCQTPPH